MNTILRRRFLQSVGTAALAAGFKGLIPDYAWSSPLPQGSSTAQPGVTDLEIRRQTFNIGGREAMATLINGSLPGPVLRFREGQNVTIRVTNKLEETTSIHWHGVIVPTGMDGVPGVSFPGIKPGETFTYRYTLRQSGTYWYHSHSGMQEQTGVFGAYIIDPAGAEPVPYDREYTVVLSDWTFEDPMRIIDKLKKQGDYYNFQRRTVPDFFRDGPSKGWGMALKDRLMWARMRMDPTDNLDVTGYTYTYLVNGLAPESNWTGLFKPGERVRLRFINTGAMTIFDVRIPGLKMTVFQADGQNVEPVDVDECRIGAAETYDVIVQPTEDKPYTIFAETIDRSGYAAATLAVREGVRGEIPPRRKRPLRTMTDMGMAQGGSAANSMPGMKMPAPQAGGQEHQKMPGMKMPANMADMKAMMHGPDHHGPGNSMIAMMPKSRLNEPGVGLEQDERRVLVYTDLRRLTPDPNHAEPDGGIEMHLTGNMERQVWGFDGKKFSEASEPIPVPYGRWTRITLVNDTMMDHPMHLHGMFMVLDNGAGASMPHKHTILIKGGEKLSFLVKPDEPGKFAFHCHLLLHMELGMFRVVSVAAPSVAGTK
jgi:CopA family copper-resistance protein